MQLGVLGAGSWATALVKMLVDNKYCINWWVRSESNVEYFKSRQHNPKYLRSVYFDANYLALTSNLEQCIAASDVIVVVTPSAYLLDIFEKLPVDIFKGKKVVSAVKGILPNQKHQLLNEYLFDQFGLPEADYFTIMGPCHAEEIAEEKLSYLTFSGADEAMASKIARYFKTVYLNTVISHDTWGTQYAAVLKNVYAIGAGIAHGLDYGDNFQSVYAANAAEEMAVFLKQVMKVKNKPYENITYANSVYLGDLLVTCYSLFSRNRRFGNMIGKGYSVQAAQLEMNMVAEGYLGSQGLHYVNSEAFNASVPLLETIYKILWENLPAAAGFKRIEAILR